MASSAEEVPDTQATEVSNIDIAHDRSNDVIVKEPNDSTRREKEINDAITAFLPELLNLTSYLDETIAYHVEKLGNLRKIDGCCRTSSLKDPASFRICRKSTRHEFLQITNYDTCYAIAQSMEKIYDHALRSLSSLNLIKDGPFRFEVVPTDHWQRVVLNLQGFYIHKMGRQGALREALDELKALGKTEAAEFTQLRDDLKLMSEQEITEWSTTDSSDQLAALNHKVGPIVDAINLTIDMAMNNPSGAKLDSLVNGISVNRDQKLWKVSRARCGLEQYNEFQANWSDFQRAVKQFVEAVGEAV